MSKWSLVGAWLAVALIASTLTWQIVSAADAQVSDRPDAPLRVDAPIISAGATTSATGSTTDPSTTTTTAGTSSTGSGSSTSVAPSTTGSPDTTAADWQVRTIHTGGGVVAVSYRPGEVVLASATPSPGFAAEVKKSGPPVVEVEFESESAKFEVKASWSNGELAVETGQEAED